MARKCMILCFCIFSLAATAFFGGCATTSQLAEVRGLTEAALSKSETAESKADAAAGVGDEARSAIAECCDDYDYEEMVKEARAAADKAQAAAEKAERIFEKISGK